MNQIKLQYGLVPSIKLMTVIDKQFNINELVYVINYLVNNYKSKSYIIPTYTNPNTEEQVTNKILTITHPNISNSNLSDLNYTLQLTNKIPLQSDILNYLKALLN